MKRILLLILIVLFCITFSYSSVQAEVRVDEGMKYTTLANSDLSPKELVHWMKLQPTRFIARGVVGNEGNDKKTMFIVFDVKSPISNLLQIYMVRILLHKDLKDITKPLVLIGYTIQYKDTKSNKSYKWNIKTNKYMEYNFYTHKFKDESIEPSTKTDTERFSI